MGLGSTHTQEFNNVPRIPCPPGDLQWCECKSDLRRSIYLVDCQRNLMQRGSYRLQVPHNTTHCRMAGDYSFQTHLVYLDLSDNAIENIENDAFADLHYLKVLDLLYNYLHTPAVFLGPLSSLRILNVADQRSMGLIMSVTL